MTNNIQEDFAYIILHKPVEENVSTDSSAILDEIRIQISQIRIYETDIEFMKYLLHLVIVAQTKYTDELNEIVESTSLTDTLLQILIDINTPENDELVVVTAILCAIGALDRVKLLAQNEDCLFGEDFIVWAELYKNQEEIQVALQQLQNSEIQINDDDSCIRNVQINQDDEQDEEVVMNTTTEGTQTNVDQKNKLTQDVSQNESEREGMEQKSKLLYNQMIQSKQQLCHNQCNELLDQGNDDSDILKKKKMEENLRDKIKQKEKVKIKLKERKKELIKDQLKEKDQQNEQLMEKEQQKEKINYQKEIKKEFDQYDDAVILKPRLLKLVFEKRVYRVSNRFIGSMNSRRFGFIAAGDEIMNNIPVPGKNFRAITYDEKEGIIRLGWFEVFRWIPSSEQKRFPNQITQIF